MHIIDLKELSIGITKSYRLAEENLTKQMLDFLVKKINPRAMVITITCKHTCMSGRGVKCHDAETTTLEEFVSGGDEAFLQKIYTQI